MLARRLWSDPIGRDDLENVPKKSETFRNRKRWILSKRFNEEFHLF